MNCKNQSNQSESLNFRRILKNLGFSGPVPLRKKLFIGKVNCKKKVQFVREYQNKILDFWKTVLFTEIK